MTNPATITGDDTMSAPTRELTDQEQERLASIMRLHDDEREGMRAQAAELAAGIGGEAGRIYGRLVHLKAALEAAHDAWEAAEDQIGPPWGEPPTAAAKEAVRLAQQRAERLRKELEDQTMAARRAAGLHPLRGARGSVELAAD